MLPPATDLLKAGKCTGAILFDAADGVRKLQVRRGIRGRGLFAASAFRNGDIITNIPGAVISNVDIKSGQEVFHWSKTKAFVMDYDTLGPKTGYGILANTAGVTGRNNAKYCCDRSALAMRLSATRKIAPGEEILVAYGRSYSTKIHIAVEKQATETQHLLDEVAPMVVCYFGAVKRMLCANCRKLVNGSNRLTHARCCSGAINK
jgi:hypothetical protein